MGYSPEEKIYSLADFPERFCLVDDPVLSSWGIRFIILNNYLAFYIIDDEKNMVIIIRFLYQKSNWNAILHQRISLV
ncbi:MAG: type II toxin-antitoxin system RelE/ParE family toxin [Lachnospiraceae bacterium]|nr:type II toxin-antitoxin system RelE/ParE family toxin [Lachnospiraceae bacterium]MDY4618043.1 type II toxin-antitoxin system RelE/ParE family toxin [Lachnospiraceae bacterium]